MVKRSLLRSLLLVTAAAVPYAGCSGKTVGQSAGGETNWLAMCTSNAECVAGAECLCGVCTKECTDDTACNGATCTRSGTEAFLDACQTEAKTPSGNSGTSFLKNSSICLVASDLTVMLPSLSTSSAP